MSHAAQRQTATTPVAGEDITLIDEDLEVPEEQIETERHDRRPRAHVVVDNQDNGETVRFWVAFSRTIGEVIARVYQEFRLEREPDDRLVRVSDGDNVFASERLTVEQYVEAQRHGRKIHWSLRTDTGGA